MNNTSQDIVNIMLYDQLQGSDAAVRSVLDTNKISYSIITAWPSGFTIKESKPVPDLALFLPETLLSLADLVKDHTKVYPSVPCVAVIGSSQFAETVNTYHDILYDIIPTTEMNRLLLTVRKIQDIKQKKKQRTGNRLFVDHLKKMLHSLIELHQIFVPETNLNSIIQSACSILVDAGVYNSAWIALLDASSKITQYASAGNNMDDSVNMLSKGNLPEYAKVALHKSSIVITHCRSLPGQYAAENRSKNTAGILCSTIVNSHDIDILGVMSVSLPDNLCGNEDVQELFSKICNDIAYCVSSSGITVIKTRYEKALFNAYWKWETTFNSIDDGITIHDKDNKIILANRAAAKIIEQPVDNCINKSCCKVFHGKDDTPAKCKIEDVLEKGNQLVFNMYEPHLKKHLNFKITPLWNNGVITGSIHVVRDISQQVQSEKRIIESEQKFRTLFETMGQGVVYQDNSGRIINMNRAAEHILGIDINMAQNMTSESSEWGSLREDGTPFPGREHPSMVALRIGERIDRTIMGIYNQKEHKYRWIEITAVPEYKDGESQPYRVFTTFEDITRLKEAQNKIERSLKEKEVLLREIHHRVKNNLQLVSSMIGLQAHYVHDKRDRLLFEDSQNRIRTMAMIHEKLYQKDDLSGISVKEYVDSFVRVISLSSYDKEKQIEVETDIDSSELSIEMAIPCGQLLYEIVSNSYKHAFKNTSKGEICISFKQTNNVYVLSISDNGCGLEDSDNIKSKETLGMELIYAFVSQLNGSLSVVVKKGTQFIITFPAGKNGK